MAMQNENESVNINSLYIEGNNLTSIFQHHGNQCLKFHFLPFLKVPERTTSRSTCQMIKNNIPAPQYSYFKTVDDSARARIETNTGFAETCGNPQNGGDSSEVSCELQSDVKAILSTYMSFAALKTNGRVITWGHPIFGGDSSNVSSYLQSDVKAIFSNNWAFAALKTNGRVITWGNSYSGGDSSNVSSYLQSDVKTIVATVSAFAALNKNGRVITWGHSNSGGDSSNVSEFLQNGVIQIEAIPNQIFCATKSDGTQVQWP